MKNIIQEYLGKDKKKEVKFQQSPFPTDTSFEEKLSVTTPLTGAELKQIEKSHRRSLNQWVCALIKGTVQTCHDIQYLTISLSGYMNVLI